MIVDHVQDPEIRQLTTSPNADLGRIIDRLASVEDLPHLFAAFTDESNAAADVSGIELILDGVEARLRRHQRQRRR